MNHGSLFSGIGGFDYAADLMGWTNIFHCEIEPFPRKVLNYYWPNAISYEDIKSTDFTIHRGHIDILTGGFPCQPYSLAGLRKGKDDERHLWPEMLRAIHEIKPRWIVGENVFGIVSWNAGLVFEEVQADLEAQGYEVQPYVLPAAGVEAPHRRDRVWFVAYSKDSRHRGREDKQRTNGGRFVFSGEQVGGAMGDKTSGCGGEWHASDTTSPGLETSGQTGIREHEAEARERMDGGSEQPCRTIIDTDSQRLEECDLPELTEEQKRRHSVAHNEQRNPWRNFPTQSPVCTRNDGFSKRLDGITFPKWRNESIKAGGNAIVPQLALQIFKAIDQYESLTH